MEIRCNPFRMSLTLLAVVVLSASCAAEGIVAATPRWEIESSNTATAYWSAGRDRDATPSRSIRAADARFQDEDAQAGDDWSGASQCHSASIALPATTTWSTSGSSSTIADGFISPANQLGPFRLNLPPPLI